MARQVIFLIHSSQCMTWCILSDLPTLMEARLSENLKVQVSNLLTECRENDQGNELALIKNIVLNCDVRAVLSFCIVLVDLDISHY